MDEPGRSLRRDSGISPSTPTERRQRRRLLQRWGATRVGVWSIKHLVAPIDCWLYRRTAGRFVTTGRPLAPLLLLTTTGRRTGKRHTTPVFYLRDGARLVLCNVTPAGERPNPWKLNLIAHPRAEVEIGATHQVFQARVATPVEVEHYWPRLLQLWPAYQTHYAHSGQRLIFVLDPAAPPDGTGSDDRALGGEHDLRIGRHRWICGCSRWARFWPAWGPLCLPTRLVAWGCSKLSNTSYL